MARERLLALTEVGLDDWGRIQDWLAQHDVESPVDDPSNVWDVRRYDDPGRDESLLWGRDGWRDGYWHARVTWDDGEVWMERSDEDERAMPLTRAYDLLLEFVTDALDEDQRHDEEVIDDG